MVSSLLLEGFIVQQGPKKLSNHLLRTEEKPHQTITCLEHAVYMRSDNFIKMEALYIDVK